MVRPPS